MSVINNVNIFAELAGLGEQEMIPLAMSTTTTVSAKHHSYITQAVADTAEAVSLGGVTTAELVIVKCISNDVDFDCNYSAAFSADITVQEGEFAVFKPAGTLYLKNNDAAETSTVEIWVWGT